jgi:RNA polymerase sigma-70 factor (ECF subfamily)
MRADSGMVHPIDSSAGLQQPSGGSDRAVRSRTLSRETTRSHLTGAHSPSEFDSFVLRSRGALLSYAFAITGDLQTAQDITQETFLRAWRMWGTLRSYEKPEAWCRRIAHNLAIGRWRRLKGRRTWFESSAETSEPDIAYLDVSTALRNLSRDQRNVVIMFYVLDMSTAEIAGELEVSEGTVKSWLHRGRSRIQSQVCDPENGGRPESTEKGGVR